MHRLRSAAAMAALAATACGGSGTLSVDDFYGGIPALANQLSVCEGGFAPVFSSFSGFADTAQLAAEQVEAKHAVASGRVKFDGAKAKSCLDQYSLNVSSCWGPGAPQVTRYTLVRPLDCLTVFTGTVADSASCYASPDCLSGACNSSSSTCPGKCNATVAAGADCSASGSCAPGTLCIHSSSGAKCGAPVAAGVACRYDEECQSGLVCAAGTCGSGVAQGASCSRAVDCAEGLWCSSGHCQPRVDAGASCTVAAGEFFGSPQCRGNQECVGTSRDSSGNVVNGKCATPQDVGGPCVRTPSAADLYTDGCFLGLICDPATSKCVMPPKAGSPCPDGFCDPNSAYCFNGNCAAIVADGQACTASEQCRLNSECNSSSHTCQPRVASNNGICHEP